MNRVWSQELDIIALYLVGEHKWTTENERMKSREGGNVASGGIWQKVLEIWKGRRITCKCLIM
jgi:hypothetical protein